MALFSPISLESMQNDGIIIQLDKWQVMGLSLFVALLCCAAFFVGTFFGGTEDLSHSELPSALSEMEGYSSHQKRLEILSQMSPSTKPLNQELTEAYATHLPKNPTDRARALTHQALQDSRSAAIKEAPELSPSALHDLNTRGAVVEGSGSDFTLQISLFQSSEAAKATAAALLQEGYMAETRQITNSGGKIFYRVEVGRFPSAEKALSFQRQFEQASGYPAVLVPL